MPSSKFEIVIRTIEGCIRHSHHHSKINILSWPCLFVKSFISDVFTADDVESCNVSKITDDSIKCLEADSFWCFSKLLDGIQDNYTFAQPGIQTRVNSLKELTSRIDSWV